MKFDKATIAKFAVKTAIGMTVSLAIGTLIKTEKSIGIKIDEYFAPSKESSTEI